MSEATNSATQMEGYQRGYLEKQRLYEEYRIGNIDLETAAAKIHKIDHHRPVARSLMRYIVGAVLPFLFVRPAR